MHHCQAEAGLGLVCTSRVMICKHVRLCCALCLPAPTRKPLQRLSRSARQEASAHKLRVRTSCCLHAGVSSQAYLLNVGSPYCGLLRADSRFQPFQVVPGAFTPAFYIEHHIAGCCGGRRAVPPVCVVAHGG